MSDDRSTLTRRTLLGRGVQLTALAVAAGLVPAALVAAPPSQPRWKRCTNCSLLFYDGYKDNGRCVAGGAHVAVQPFDYVLTYDDSTGPGQGDWRYCRYCKALFFNGYPAKGTCPGRAEGHQAAGYNFFLPHDRQPDRNEHTSWRFCSRCEGLFYEVGENPRCPAGDRHAAAGYVFVLRLGGGYEL
jgi:hypothetical protein